MEIKLTHEDIKHMISGEMLMKYIAEEVVNSKKDKTWTEEFDGELIKAFKEAQKIILKQYVEEYYGVNIKDRIAEALKTMDRKEVITLLTNQ